MIAFAFAKYVQVMITLKANAKCQMHNFKVMLSLAFAKYVQVIITCKGKC